MKRIRWILWVPVVVLAALGLAAYAGGPRVPTLVLRDEVGNVKARIECPEGRFVHRYVHSIHRSDVDEEYEIEQDGTLHLTATRFDTLGVGIPYDAGKGFSQEGGRFVLRLDRSFRSLPIRVSPLAGHLVIVGDKKYPFTEWFAPEDLVVVEAKLLRRRYLSAVRR
jgi:hypothetical protein